MHRLLKEGRAPPANVEQDKCAQPAIIDDRWETSNMYRAHSAIFRSTPDQASIQHHASEQPTAILLTAREKEVLQWSAAGKSSWEIGVIFNCTEAGVNYHFSNIRRKFGVSSRGSAVVKALELGLIDLP